MHVNKHSPSNHYPSDQIEVQRQNSGSLGTHKAASPLLKSDLKVSQVATATFSQKARSFLRSLQHLYGKIRERLFMKKADLDKRHKELISTDISGSTPQKLKDDIEQLKALKNRALFISHRASDAIKQAIKTREKELNNPHLETPLLQQGENDETAIVLASEVPEDDMLALMDEILSRENQTREDLKQAEKELADVTRQLAGSKEEFEDEGDYEMLEQEKMAAEQKVLAYHQILTEWLECKKECQIRILAQNTFERPPEKAQEGKRLDTPALAIQENLASIRPKGIPNITNSCYINSTFQALLAIPHFKERIMSSEWPGFKRLENDLVQLAKNRGLQQLGKSLPQLFEGWKTQWKTLGEAFSLDEMQESIKADPSYSPEEKKVIQEACGKYFAMKHLQATLQEFSQALDHAQHSRDMRAHAYALRAAIFDTGLFPRNQLKKQQDAAELMEKINDFVGDKIASKITPAPGSRDKQVEEIDFLKIPLEKTSKSRRHQLQGLCDHLFAKQGGQVQLSGSPPENLVLQLDRSPYIAGSDGIKIKDPVELPEDHILDFSQGFADAQIEGVRYKVVAAIHHEGSDILSGHYTAFVEKEGHWYKADDSAISSPSEKSLRSGLATSYLFILKKIP